MKNEDVRLIDSTTIPNEYLEYDVKPEKKRRIKLKKLDAIDMLMIPLAIGIAVSLGFLIYNITQIAGLNENLTGLIGAFVK
ncbi:MAG TPA: hypothetical protein IAC70_05410 [Candidatus Faecicola pullistercoris]|nr:hypothetical protein [Candidatus Faecicola pullistercoris]